MKNSIWSVVTIQEVDGHEFNGIFYTDCQQSISEFAELVYPLLVCKSNYETEEKARDAFLKMCDGYITIGPYFYQKMKSSFKLKNKEGI